VSRREPRGRLLGSANGEHAAPIEWPLLLVELARRIEHGHDLRNFQKRPSWRGRPQVALPILERVVVDQPPPLGLLEYLPHPGEDLVDGVVRQRASTPPM
jgi:hypothetical protein